jgi:hypothetical protein
VAALSAVPEAGIDEPPTDIGLSVLFVIGKWGFARFWGIDSRAARVM